MYVQALHPCKTDQRTGWWNVVWSLKCEEDYVCCLLYSQLNVTVVGRLGLYVIVGIFFLVSVIKDFDVCCEKNTFSHIHEFSFCGVNDFSTHAFSLSVGHDVSCIRFPQFFFAPVIMIFWLFSLCYLWIFCGFVQYFIFCSCRSGLFASVGLDFCIHCGGFLCLFTRRRREAWPMMQLFAPLCQFYWTGLNEVWHVISSRFPTLVSLIYSSPSSAGRSGGV